MVKAIANNMEDDGFVVVIIIIIKEDGYISSSISVAMAIMAQMSDDEEGVCRGSFFVMITECVEGCRLTAVVMAVRLRLR